jgi:hypothetical protein
MIRNFLISLIFVTCPLSRNTTVIQSKSGNNLVMQWDRYQCFSKLWQAGWGMKNARHNNGEQALTLHR